MKYLLLSIFIAFDIMFSIPSINVCTEQEVYDVIPFETDSIGFDVSEDKKIEVTAVGIQFTPYINKRIYLTHYFKSLTQNFAFNANTTCSFVAVGMLLSYYDSYLCDDIIPEQYDVASIGNEKDMVKRNNSPGILFDTISHSDAQKYYSKETSYELTAKECYNVLRYKYGNNSFQLKLIDFAIDNNLIELNDNSTSISLSADNKIVISFLEKYLESVNFNKVTDFTISECAESTNGISQNDVRQFIIENIDKGNPVYVYGANSSLDGAHSFICYDYDDINNIYAHMGWHYNFLSHNNPFIKYPKRIKAVAINFNRAHKHSYNYKVGDTAYCYCDEDISYHNHSYDTIINLNKKLHRMYCDCGKYMDSPHWIQGSTSGRYAKCAACGASLDLNDGPYIVVMSLSKTPNGSYIHPSGIPVIMEEDVEAYLNGTLKFGNGISNYDYI